MLIETQAMIVCQKGAVDALAKIRKEWELTADGESLVDVEASVGLLLADIVVALGLPPVEIVQVLGAKLAGELQDIFPEMDRPL